MQARNELYQVAGDQADPMGGAARGRAGQMNLTETALGHPYVRYKDQLLELDVYKIAGAPMYIHIICPRCHNASKIQEDNKAFSYEPTRIPKILPFLLSVGVGAPHGGSLSVEKFECSWELGPERQEFGVGLCRWRVGIDNNVAKDA